MYGWTFSGCSWVAFLCFLCHCCLLFFFFFFQAEDGIRDGHVTGVQTCALPICPGTPAGRLLRSYWQPIAAVEEMPIGGAPMPVRIMSEDLVLFRDDKDRLGLIGQFCPHRGDRKSTRLNSIHVAISYAVFCLKKK